MPAIKEKNLINCTILKFKILPIKNILHTNEKAPHNAEDNICSIHIQKGTSIQNI